MAGPPDERLAAQQARARPLLEDLGRWLHATLTMLSRKSDTAAAILYPLKLWPALNRYADGRIEFDNSAAERALRGVALGRRNFLFARRRQRRQTRAAIYGFIGTARLNDIDHEAWLRHVLEHIAEHPVNQVRDLLPWTTLANSRPLELRPAAIPSTLCIQPRCSGRYWIDAYAGQKRSTDPQSMCLAPLGSIAARAH